MTERLKNGNVPLTPAAQALIENVAAQLAARRDELNLSNAKVAASARTDPSNLSHIMRGTVNVSLGVLHRLADEALDADLVVTIVPRSRPAAQA